MNQFVNKSEFPKVFVSTDFIIEAVNNLYPLILTTPRPYTPSTPNEDWLKYTTTPTDPPFGNTLTSLVEKLNAFWGDPYECNIYSQYCAITRKNKNSELMASHNDDVYSSLTKMIQYVNDSVAERLIDINNDSDHWGMHFWHPILVLQNSLMVVNENENGDIDLANVPYAALEFNYHDEEGRQSSALVSIVVEDQLLKFLQTVVSLDDSINEELIDFRLNGDN